MTVIDKCVEGINKAGVKWMEENGYWIEWADVPREILAIACLTTFRDSVTDEMEDAGHAENRLTGEPDDILKAMINAALNEGKP